MNMWQNISDAVEFYSDIGFTYIDAPWLVTKEINKLTCEDASKISEVSGAPEKGQSTLIGSGEQGLTTAGPIGNI